MFAIIISEIRPAFAATFTNERAMPLSHGEILKFDSVNLNIGEGYDSTTGYFTVPKAGIYFVSCTIRSIENKHISAYLWKNNKKLVLAYGRNGILEVLASQLVYKKVIYSLLGMMMDLIL